MDKIILTTPEDLRAMIVEAIGQVVPELAAFRRKNEAVESDNLTIEAAVEFLSQQGWPTTKATLYNYVFQRRIPFKKFGRRTVFSKRELLDWVDHCTTRPEADEAEAVLRIAQSANRKNR